jgi:hypothetical protein
MVLLLAGSALNPLGLVGVRTLHLLARAFLRGDGDPSRRIVEFAALEHGDQHGQEAVGNAPEGSGVGMLGGA